MNEARDIYGNPVYTSDGKPVSDHPVYGPTTTNGWGQPEPISPPPPPPPWDNN